METTIIWQMQSIWYIQYVDRLLDLLNKYNYQVPLVDIVTGNEFKDNK